jgi:uncharacterized protein (TIGR00730 family)
MEPRGPHKGSGVCVFAGSGVGNDEAFSAAANDLGREIVRRGHDLVFGGESVGLMGAVADGTIDAGGKAIGVIPRFLAEIGALHEGAETHLVDTLAERKQLMADLAAGFVVLPGGLGTLDELTEMVTWTQLGVHDKPLVLLDVAGCWGKLSELLDSMVTNGFLRTENRALLQFATDAEAAVAAIG